MFVIKAIVSINRTIMLIDVERPKINQTKGQQLATSTRALGKTIKWDISHISSGNTACQSFPGDSRVQSQVAHFRNACNLPGVCCHIFFSALYGFSRAPDPWVCWKQRRKKRVLKAVSSSHGTFCLCTIIQVNNLPCKRQYGVVC